ncbi:MAG: KH domain-containing protein [Clostridia bacterium]|nr:KH domain-containing protein [Clostridia bacterium]
MTELIKFIAQSLVDHPEDVDVRLVDGEEGAVIELRVNPDDMGKVIGKQGRIAKTIRAVLKAASVREGKLYTLDII